MKQRCVNILACLIVVLAVVTFSACEVDDRIAFVTGMTPTIDLPEVPKPAAGKTTVVLWVPANTPTGCYAVGTMNDWAVEDTNYGFAAVPSADNQRWVACTFDYVASMQMKVLAIPSDPNIALGWSFQWGCNMGSPEENNVVVLGGAGKLNVEEGGTVLLSDLADGGITYIQVKSWASDPNQVYVPVITVPVVATSAPKQVNSNMLIVGGDVISDGGGSVTERGVVYNTTPNPTITADKITTGSGTGTFTCELTNLQANTTYYIRAYAINSQGVAYGEEMSCTTLKVGEGMENNHVYVDLGLSVKWATMNVGANKAEEKGDYFAWGEINQKETYNWSTYKWCKGSAKSQTKYCTDSSYGVVDNKTQLDLADDAASQNWDGSWRIPTDNELTELREQCTWRWATQNGVNGFTVTSKSNGRSIFLPASGYYYDGSSQNVGNRGDYWSSSLGTDYPDVAWSVFFNSNDVFRSNYNRCYGRTVRAVCE